MTARPNKYASSVTRNWQIPLDLYQWLLVKAEKSGYSVNDFIVAHFENVMRMESDSRTKSEGGKGVG